MPFNQNDIYTSSGTVQLFNSWTPYVSKFDTSSYYNWEQDNLPLYDLEERTYELWEQQGFTTSAGVPGLALSVSADTPQATLDADNTIFTDVSSCIAAIPKVVRFPVLVEVANFGDLGVLELHNFRIEEGGSIEIINRTFGRSYNTSSVSKGIPDTPAYNASHNITANVSSLDLSNALTDVSALQLSTPVFSSVNDTRSNNVNGVFYPVQTGRKAPLSVQIGNTSFYSTTVNQFDFQAFEVAPTLDDTLPTLDISAVSTLTGGYLNRSQIADEGELGGNYYFNSLNSISVQNCDGPIYIRNFFVNGNKGVDDCIKITNSDVLLENCAAVRGRKSGFKFNNSKVTLSRSAYAYRNYELPTTSTRTPEVGYGFHAVNSDVLVSSLPLDVTSTSVGDTGALGKDCTVLASRNYAGIVLDNSTWRGGVKRSSAATESQQSIIGAELNTGFGAIINNSQVDTQGLFDFYQNSVGIKAVNSQVVFESLCFDGHANEAIKGNNSLFINKNDYNPTTAGQQRGKQIDLSGNAQHLVLENNSSFTFEIKDHVPQNYGNTRFIDDHGSLSWEGGDKVYLPAISVNDNSNVDLLNCDIRVSGIDVDTPSYGKALLADNGSTASFYGTENGCTFVVGPGSRSIQINKAGLYANNSSNINLHGPTAIYQFGVDALAENNSTINIKPATPKDSFGLGVSAFDLHNQSNHTSVELHSTRACLVVNKNSTLNLQNLGSFGTFWGADDINRGIDYDAEMNTSAYTGSGSLQFFPNPQDDDAVAGVTDNVAPGADFPTFEEGTRHNYLLDDLLNSPDLTGITLGGVCVRAVEDSVVNVNNVHFPTGTNESALDGVYYNVSGSECDRFGIWNIADTSRLNASYLSVSGGYPVDSLYHGPSSIWASSVTLGSYGDPVPASGAPINTPDTGSLSILDAFGAGSAVWSIPSGTTVNNSFNAFYPVSSADINQETIDALADAGIAVSGSPTTYKWGATEHTSQNRGPFRIYWSPKSSAKVLQTDLSGFTHGAFPHGGDFYGVVGPAYHIFAQGYNCSAPLSAVVLSEGNASSVYPDLLKLSHDSDGDGTPDSLWTSGFYYCDELVEENPTQCMLDESAGFTFANAQNASVGMGGRPKKVTIYRARSETNRGAEAYPGDPSGTLGFKSANIFDLKRDN